MIDRIQRRTSPTTGAGISCGSHLLCELTFVVEANAFRWARLMMKLLLNPMKRGRAA
ncbi:MAG: hypothetical protein OXG44_19190 [Gammaproteobacteria bacterium]|nr:hypothetical protein [Gammaproteobacteria bacterium]